MSKNITLEISLKPFWDLSTKGIGKVCEKIYQQWLPLTKESDSISILFWSSDGSEILDYKGKLDDTLEWAKYIGVANPEIYGDIPNIPQRDLSMHHSPRLYRQNPPEFTYGDLKNVLTTIRNVFSRHDKSVRVGTTFDPGPEFAKSSFKYERHQEICMGNTLGDKKSFVCCYAKLQADKTSYAGFPNGIEAGTSLGMFLGKQTKHFCEDLGFDYIWLSNGFGFGLETWGVCGALFDGERFDNSACESVKEKIFSFWKDFKREISDLPIETRGTNLSTAMDLASDAVPLREIYQNVSGITPPPNSPWAALNGDFGMELAGWMSHIANLPEGSGYPFRFYTHDPWFINSPWLDRYGRNPHDIYMPLAITRLDENGRAMNPDSVKFLSIDNSYGEMPDQVPDEVIPHVKQALRTAPDTAGPVIWLYPFDEYHDMTFSGQAIDEVFFGDWFMRSAINNGFQVNTVVSSSNFKSAIQNRACHGNTIVAPTVVSNTIEIFEELKTFVFNGGNVLLYGPVSSSRLLDFLGLKKAPSLEGEFEATINEETVRILHRSLYSAGGLDTLIDQEGASDVVNVHQSGETRAIALRRKVGQGQLAWIRGTNSFEIAPNGRYPQMLATTQYFHPENLMRMLQADMGISLRLEKHSPHQSNPVLVPHYHANALFLSTYAPDMTVAEHLKYPEGAPIFVETETYVKGGYAIYHLPKAARMECRIFVEMGDGLVKCEEFCLCCPEVKRRLKITGLKNATIRFRPETGYEESTKILLNPQAAPYTQGEFLTPFKEERFTGTVLTHHNVSGDILVSW